MEFILIVIAVALGIALASYILDLLACVGKFTLFTVLILLFYFLVRVVNIHRPGNYSGNYYPSGSPLASSVAPSHAQAIQHCFTRPELRV